MAAKELNVGKSRVWIDPEAIDDVSMAITREDIRYFIKEGLIKAEQKEGISRARARKIKSQKNKGRRKGHGSRKGTKYARFPRKKRWIEKVRALRKLLKEYKEQGKLVKSSYRMLYRMIKGNYFRSKAHLESYIEQQGLIRRR